PGHSYRDVEARIARLNSSQMKNEPQSGPAPSSWLDSLFRGNRKKYGSVLRGERPQRFFNSK
ncbi:MAG: hypothetical protein WAU05_11520, partial [Nitrospira sp.]